MPPWIAAPRPWGTAAWMARHAVNVARAKAGGIDVVFLGDSITEFFATRAPDEWASLVAPLGSVANFGIAGDRTQFLLWRIENGELQGSGARVVVLEIGTNNLAAATPDSVARGVTACVDAVHVALPQAVIVLEALLPRGAPESPLRLAATAVNARLAPLADGVHVRWFDAGAAFLAPDGTISPALMADGLHPTAAGYDVLASALRPVLAAALSK